MLALSRHFYIFIYILASFQGLALLIANQMYLMKTSDPAYKKLQYFNCAFFIKINFIYFYKDYLSLSLEVKQMVLSSITIIFVILIYYSYQILYSFSGLAPSLNRKIFFLASTLYLAVFILTCDASFAMKEQREIPFSSAMLIGSSLFFFCVAAFYYIRFFRSWGKCETMDKPKELFLLFVCGILGAVFINTYGDIYYCFFSENNSIVSMNIYNLMLLLYIFVNCVSFCLFYDRKIFIDRIVNHYDTMQIAPLGEAVLSLSDKRSILNEMAEKYRLTEREKEVLELLYSGKSNLEISQTLFISIHTVKHHANSIYKKMEIKGRVELLAQINHAYF